MPEPLVSILIATYNREKFIARCIQSALDQTLRDLEVVIVDNCSTDRTVEICREFTRNDPRVRVFCNETNIGPVRNWMRCAEFARGRFGHFIMSDDVLFATALEKSVPYMEDPDVGFVVTAALVGTEPENGSPAYTWGGQNGKIESARYLRTLMADTGHLPVSPGSTLFRLSDVRRNLVLDIASPVDHDFAGHGGGPDLLVSLLTANAYPAIVHLREPLAFFCAHENSITTAKREAVSRAYRQARVWFASRLRNRDLLDYTFGVAWLQKMRWEGRWIAPAKMRAEFLLPSDPRPRLVRSLFSALTSWALPRATSVLLTGRR